MATTRFSNESFTFENCQQTWLNALAIKLKIKSTHRGAFFMYAPINHR